MHNRYLTGFTGQVCRRGRVASLLAAGAAGLAFGISGCGGGGGGTAPQAETSRASLTIQWPARSRTASSPSSALSAVVRIAGAGLSGSDLVFTINRDVARAEGYTEQYNAPVNTRTGQFTVTLTFHSLANGQGGVVGSVSRAVTLASGQNSLGDIVVEGTVASVAVAPRQTIAVNEASDVVFTPFDTVGSAIAGVTPGSAFFTVTGGHELLRVVSGQLMARDTPGVAQVTATVDGKTSAPQKVGVGSAISSLAAAGTRGAVPLVAAANDFVGGVTFTRGSVRSDQLLPVTSNWFYPHQITAPAGYGDRRFDHWAQGNVSVTSSLDYNYVPAEVTGNLSFTAVYVPRAFPDGGFTPNFSRPEFLHWAQFPLRVYVASPEAAERIKAGLDKWVAATGGVISYETVANPALADITFTLGTPPSGLKGMTTADFDPDTRELLHVDVVLLQSAAEETYPTGIDLLSLYASHEFGHALGITASAELGSGHSTDPSDTMFPATNPSAPVITERDINTLENIYPGLFNGGSVSRAGARAVRGTRKTGRSATVSVRCP